MLTADSILRPSSDVIYTTLHNRQAVLLHMSAKRYYSLNRTGARIWHLIGNGLPLGEIVDKIVVEYEVAPAEAKSGVFTLAERLVDAELGLVVTDIKPDCGVS